MLSGLELKIKRIQLGIKGIELAKRLEVDQSYISKLENGVQKIPLHMYKKWVEALRLGD